MAEEMAERLARAEAELREWRALGGDGDTLVSPAFYARALRDSREETLVLRAKMCELSREWRASAGRMCRGYMRDSLNDYASELEQLAKRNLSELGRRLLRLSDSWHTRAEALSQSASAHDRGEACGIASCVRELESAVRVGDKVDR
jgi:hypothetical protein